MVALHFIFKKMPVKYEYLPAELLFVLHNVTLTC